MKTNCIIPGCKWVTRIIVLLILIFPFGVVSAQKVTSMIITDKMASVSGYSSKPKPGPAKTTFTLTEEKGATVIVYVTLEPDPELKGDKELIFSAYKDNNGKLEWYDDRIAVLKPTSSFYMVAFNLAEKGRYRMAVADNKNQEIVYGEGWCEVNE